MKVVPLSGAEPTEQKPFCLRRHVSWPSTASACFMLTRRWGLCASRTGRVSGGGQGVPGCIVPWGVAPGEWSVGRGLPHRFSLPHVALTTTLDHTRYHYECTNPTRGSRAQATEQPVACRGRGAGACAEEVDTALVRGSEATSCHSGAQKSHRPGSHHPALRAEPKCA